MGRYILKRLLQLIPTLFLSTVVVFLLIHFIPGDPALVMLGTDARVEEIAELQERLGLNEPLHLQFVHWLGRIVTGDFGRSLLTNRPVLEMILERAPITAELALAATLVSLIIGIPAGIVAASRQNTNWDRFFMLSVLGGISIPNFWLGLMLLAVLAASLGWFPLVGWVMITEDPIQGLWYLILPAVSLGSVQAAVIARMTRSSMLEVLRNDYIRTARAKGLRERIVVYRHALKNAMIPVVTVVGINIAHLLAGAVAIETVFGIPGLGRFLIYTVQSRDYPSVQAILLLSVGVYVLANLVVDIIYVFLDPRIRYA